MIHEFLALYRVKEKLVGDMPEAQWRMLLDLAANGPLDTTALSYGSGVPATTSLRHLGLLVRNGWAERTGDPTDRRKTIYCLTPAARRLFVIGIRRAA